MNFAAAGDFPLGIVPGFRYNETESDISGAEEKMLKFKIMLVVFIALVYYGVTYCMLSPGICKYYADYYLLFNRRREGFSPQTDNGNDKLFPYIPL